MVAARCAAFLTVASLLAAVFAANQTYFFCRMTGELQTDCCCSSDDAALDPSVLSADCCEVRTHDAPSEGVRAETPVVLGAALAVLHGAPLAIVPHASERSRRLDFESTGPPLDDRHALIPVLLL